VNAKSHYHHGDLRQTLIREALLALESGDEESLSLRALAKAAGVSPNAPYRHFASRKELLAALAAEGFALFADRIEEAGDKTGPALERLVALGEAYVSFAVGHPALYHLMFSPLGYSLESERCALQSARAFGLLMEALAQAQAEGYHPETPLENLAIAYWSQIHGSSSMTIDRLLPPGLSMPRPGDLFRLFFSLPTKAL